MLEGGAHAAQFGQFVLDWWHRDRPEPAAKTRSRFENRNRFGRIAGRESVGGEGTGHACTNDDDVDGLAFGRSFGSASS